MLRPIAHSGNGQHLSPGFEKKLTNLVAHRHVVEHVAHFNRELNRHGLFLFNLLGNADDARSTVFFRQKFGEKILKFVVDQLKHPTPGFRVLLDHLHNALDFNFHRAARYIDVKAQHARAHSVYQATRRVLQGAKKLRL